MITSSRPAILIRREGYLEAILPESSLLTNRIRKSTNSLNRRSRLHQCRIWKMLPNNLDPLIAILKELDMTVEVYSPPRAPNERPHLPPTDYDTLHVTPNAPLPIIDASYRALARLYHPDSTGKDTNAIMAQINAAYERITQKTHA